MDTIENGIKRRDRIVTTAIIFYLMFVYGMVSNCDAPALIDFKYIFDVPLHHLSLIYFFLGTGYILGSLSGLLYNKLNRQLTLIITYALAAVAIGLFPHAHHIHIFYFLWFVAGLGNGTFDLVQSVWLIEMWNEKSKPILHLAELLMGLGWVTAPIIESPFLSGFSRNSSANDTTDRQQTITPQQRKAKLAIPFGIFSVLLLIGLFLLLVMFILNKYQDPSPDILKYNSDNSVKVLEAEENYWWRISMIILMTLALGFFEVTEETYQAFAPTFFQLEPLKLSAQEASWIHSIEGIGFTAGRATGVFVSIKSRPEVMLTVHYTVIILSLLVLSFYTSTSYFVVSATNLIIGFGFSSIWPSLFSHLEQYLVITNNIGSVILSVSCLFWSFAPYFVGKILEEHPMSLIYLDLLFITISLLLFIFIRISINYKLFSSKTSNIHLKESNKNSLPAKNLQFVKQ